MRRSLDTGASPSTAASTTRLAAPAPIAVTRPRESTVKMPSSAEVHRIVASSTSTPFRSTAVEVTVAVSPSPTSSIGPCDRNKSVTTCLTVTSADAGLVGRCPIHVDTGHGCTVLIKHGRLQGERRNQGIEPDSIGREDERRRYRCGPVRLSCDQRDASRPGFSTCRGPRSGTLEPTSPSVRHTSTRATCGYPSIQSKRRRPVCSGLSSRLRRKGGILRAQCTREASGPILSRRENAMSKETRSVDPRDGSAIRDASG